MKQLLASVLLLTGAAASAQTFLEPPRYVVGVWDGAPTAAGLWFTIDGEPPSGDARLSVVDRLPPGVTIDAAQADLRFSAALASHLGLRVGVPTLFEIGRIPPPAQPASQVDVDLAASDYADGHARVTALLEELRTAAADTVAAGYQAQPATPAAAPEPAHGSTAGTPRRAGGGLVALDPRAWP